MPYSVILAHPRPGSLNHALARAACAAIEQHGGQARFHDLHAEGFDPLLPAAEVARDAPLPPLITTHCREIAEAEGIVIVHPNWWGMPPAILAGWVDRVLRPGVAYEFLEGDAGEGVPRGLLAARAAVVVNTSNTAREREARVFGDPLDRIWKDCIFGLCGVAKVRRRMFETVVTSDPATRREWIAQTEALVRETFFTR
ncbi:NAD(P)H-dependent oxidoreductase [Solidesulfovibrio sp.]|uniref:NAD(P)H-dependent oxidoreductase n=1 Tax=Solidesulfovibrio sp. TaxID=2910990 RepID=UPI0026201926|nr:NAD(P)H-dependent oxidoreductase [Solidesulfovibrio sp.]